MKPRSQHRAAIALLASLALHLTLLGWWVHSARSVIQSPTPREIVELEVREVRRPQARPTPAPAPLPAPVPSTAPVAKRRPASAPRPAAAAPQPSPALDSTQPETGFPVAAPDVPGQVAAPAIDLGAAGTRSAGRVADAREPEPAPAEPARGIHAPAQDPDLNHRVASLIDADRGRRNVERGLVDPYFSELGKALATNWQLPRDVEHPMDKGLLHGVGENFLEGLRGWQEAAQDWAHTGTIAIGKRPEDGRDEAQAAGDMQAMADAFSHRGALVVRLTQSRAGRLLDVELVAPSGNPAVDVAVLRGLRSGATVLPVPPLEGMGIRDPIRSVWAFEVSIKVCPPAPILSGSFDLAAPFDAQMGSGVNVCIPLDRTVQKHVQLLEVD